MGVLTGIAKGILLLGFLYMFICSLDILSSAFQLVGGKKKSVKGNQLKVSAYQRPHLLY